MTLPPGLMALLTLAVGVAAWVRRDRTGARGLAAALAAGGLAFAALALLERASAALPAASAAAASLRLAAVTAALVLWGALAVLAFQGARRRDLFWIGPFGLLALLGLASRVPSTGGALVLALPVVARWRWQEKVDRGALGWVMFGALVLPLLAFLPVPGDRAATDTPGMGRVRYAAWARELAGLYLLLALPGLVRSWSLSIRRVGRRLGLLMLLSGVVPVLLVVLMWGFSTQLGVRAERALFATRLVQQTSGDLRGDLLVARAAEAPGREALRAVAAARPRWRALRVWRGGARARWDSLCDESARAAWPDSLPQQGL